MPKKTINDLVGAIVAGDINMVKQCLKDEVNINDTVHDSYGFAAYPFIHAFRCKQFEIFKLLFDETDGNTLIRNAYCMIHQFLDNRPSLKTYRESGVYYWLLENNRYSKFGHTKLQIQVAFDDVAAVKEVLKNNQKNEFEKDAFGRSPFIFVCSPEMLELIPSSMSYIDYIDNEKRSLVDKSSWNFGIKEYETLPVMFCRKAETISLLLNYVNKGNEVDLNGVVAKANWPYLETIAAKLVHFKRFDILTNLMGRSSTTCVNLNVGCVIHYPNIMTTIPIMLAQAKQIDLLEKLFASLKDSEFELLEVAPKGADNLISLLKDSPSTLRKIIVKTSSESINRTFKLLMNIKDDGSFNALMQCLRHIFDDRFSEHQAINGGVLLFKQIYLAYKGFPEIAKYLSRRLERFRNDIPVHSRTRYLLVSTIREIFDSALPDHCDLNEIRDSNIIDLVKTVLLATGAPNKDDLIMERFTGILKEQAKQETRQAVQEQNNNSLPSVGLFQSKTHGDYRDNKASTDDNNTKKTKLDDTQSPSFSNNGVG